jgi:cell division protease FtsH
MGGATFALPERDRIVYTGSYLRAQLKVTLGGRVADEVYCGEISSGAASDIQQATAIARSMVSEWGMSEALGFVHYGEERGGAFDLGTKNYSDETAAKIDAEVKAILDQAYADTKKLILEYRERGEAIAAALIKYETLSGDEVNALIRGESLDKPTVTDLLDSALPAKDVGEARPIPAKPKPNVDLGGGELPQPS